MRNRLTLTLFILATLSGSSLFAEDAKPAASAIRDAIGKTIPLLEKGSAGSAEQRTCFTCHNQAVPVIAIIEARDRGFEIDEENLQRQLKHTTAHLTRGKKGYLAGKRQGGGVVTAGYALWTLEAGEHKPGELTAAVTGFLLDYQKKADHWSQGGNRPPSSGSHFTATYLALRGLEYFGTEEQAAKIEERKKTVGKWLHETTPSDTEDRVFRLRSLGYVDADEKTIQQAVTELIEQQRDDGGWAQLADSNSDAYATATTLVALLRDGNLNADHPTVQRGIGYLLDTQQEDGSWHVVTRAKPFQKYFESGFPHGKDQFISMAASSWATIALTLVLPESP
jgi:N-acyl-D-amino-acid deacylase